MLNDLRIPRMGSVENARLVEWRVAEGQSYDRGQILYEIETDKTSVEVEADEPGVLAQQSAMPGDEFKVGDKVGLWAAPGTTATAIAQAREGDMAGTVSSRIQKSGEVTLSPNRVSNAVGVDLAQLRAVPRSAAQGRKVSPLARRLAAQHGIDLSSVVGTGIGGKISGKDVLAGQAAHAAHAESTDYALPLLQSAQPVRSTIDASVARTDVDAGHDLPEDAHLVPHSLRRRTIAARMVQAGAIPSLTADMDADLSALMAYRKSESGRDTTVLSLIAQATVSALLEHPRLNAHWRDDAIVSFRGVHLGVAVDTPDGLVVPVIRHAERLSALGLKEAIGALAAKARAGLLRPEDMDGGSFTISNPGALGPVVRAEALLSPPQVALLGLPGIVHTPVAVRDGAGWAVAVRPMLRLSLTFDHRALDGGPVIAFLNTLKAKIEEL